MQVHAPKLSLSIGSVAHSSVAHSSGWLTSADMAAAVAVRGQPGGGLGLQLRLAPYWQPEANLLKAVCHAIFLVSIHVSTWDLTQ